MIHGADVCYNRDSHNSPPRVVTNMGSGDLVEEFSMNVDLISELHLKIL